MQFLSSDWILTCDDDFRIIKDGAIVFDEKIIAIDSLQNLQKKYPNETFLHQGDNSVLMPGLVNSHVHLEFSANKTTLRYGNFIEWLFSVIKNREELIEKATKELIDSELKKMIHNGTTTIGAVSSYGFDLASCVDSKINVVYFNEVLGSKPEMLDTLYQDLLQRVNLAKKHTSKRFIPAIAIHAPYSTHPFLIRKVLQIAKEEQMSVSAHFMESRAENDWLNYSTGDFVSFFGELLGQTQSLQRPSEFLSLFQGIKNLSFTHCVEANQKELAKIKELGATIIHCPNSNRLLNNRSLTLDYLDSIPMALGTDGLSSNYTLNLFEEMRNGFFIHTHLPPNELAKRLILAATKDGARGLGLYDKGVLGERLCSDIIGFCLEDRVEEENLLVSIVLHTTPITTLFIGGESV